MKRKMAESGGLGGGDFDETMLLQKIFSNIGVPVEVKRTDADLAALKFNGRCIGIINLKRCGLESMLAQAAALILKEIYRGFRSEALRFIDEEKFSVNSYYWILLLLGGEIMSKIPEESKRKPSWLKNRIQEAIRSLHVDHVFYSHNGEYISEPYSMSMRDFEKLIEFCRENGLEFTVQGRSRHFPGHTFRVTIKPSNIGVNAIQA